VPGERPPDRDGYAYPLRRRNDRELPADWRGTIYVWDIDNTYLLTEWASFRDLVRIRFESAEDKLPVPGVVELMAGLRRIGADGERPPFYFVSASPETMRTVLEKRMLLDGVVHDGITFRNLRRLRYLRDIFGYKVAALLLYRLEHPAEAREVLFGDDREHDADVYLTYTRICAGAVRGAELRDRLLERGVRRSAATYVATLADELPARDPVDWMIIRRLRPRQLADPTEASAGGGPDEVEDERTVYVDDYAEAAALFRALGRLDATDYARVLAAVREAGLAARPLQAVERLAGRLPAAGVETARAETAPA